MRDIEHFRSARAPPSLRVTATVGTFIPKFLFAVLYGIAADILADTPDVPRVGNFLKVILCQGISSRPEGEELETHFSLAK